MATRLTRPPYILAHPADTMGCGYHRIVRPLEILMKAGYVYGRCDMSLLIDARLSAMAPDITVWQRQHDPVQVRAMIKSRELAPDTFHIYEIDDCMSAVPPWSPHKAYIPYDIDQEQAAAIKLCDAVTVTTPELATHIREICDFDLDIRIIPNMLAKEELDRVDEIRRMKPPATNGKIRIGWGGGHAHSGDLELLLPAMREFHNKVEWFFLGNKPDCEVPIEFNQGVPPPEFLSTLASARLNMIVAPLVDCKFNRCKSNLRLIEAGAIGVPVIASPVAPYVFGSPPVTYAETPEDWVRLIGEFVADPDSFNPKGQALKQWMQRGYVMDDRLEERLRSWMPKGQKAFVPKRRNHASNVVLVCAAGQKPRDSKHTVVKTLDEAFALSSDVIYVRGGTTLSDEQISRLMRHLNQGDTASVSPLSNDGGAAGFPQVGQFTSVEGVRFGAVDGICKRMFGPVRAEVTNPAGPVVVLSRRAMELCGFPDTSLSDIEAALVEWGVMAAAKGFMNVVVADTYVTTSEGYNYVDTQRLLAQCQLRYPIKPLSPDPLADVRAELEMAYHKEFYDTPTPSANASYAEWCALFSEVGEPDTLWMGANFPDVNIKHFTYPVPVEALKDVEWAVFTGESTSLCQHALYTFAKAIYDKNGECKEGDGPVLFYSDHDFLTGDGTTDRHDCKSPRIDKHLLYQRDYITQVFAVHVPTMLKTLPVDCMLLLEPSLYGLVLDIVEREPESRIVHIPRVLAHLAAYIPSDLINNVVAKVEHATRRLAGTGVTVANHPRFPFVGEINYSGAVASDVEPPLVSIIMLTGGQIEVVSPGLDSLLAMTDYPNLEVIVVEATKFNPQCHEYLEDRAATDARVRLLRYSQPYNWSAINNWAVKQAGGEYLVLMNDDTRVPDSSKFWLREMVGAAMQPQVGAVGARLLYPWGVVQHVGVVAREGFCGHLHKGLHESQPGYNGIAVLSHQATAVTGAVLLVRRALFDEVGGLNEKLAHNFNDVAFCLDLDRKGYRNVVAARAVLQHLEGVSRLDPSSDKGTKLQQEETILLSKLYPETDPYWNPNLFFAHMQGGTLVIGLNCDMMAWPAAPWPHRDADWRKEKILLIGDDGSGWVEEARKGSVLYFAMMQGYAMQLVRPPLSNVKPFDIREPTVPQHVLHELGITKIVVRSILGSSVECLPFLLQLGIEVEYRPITAEAACPRLDFKTTMPDGTQGDCGSGWTRGLCQGCLAKNGSPFGAVSVVGWRDQWARFFDKATFVSAANESVSKAVGEIYPSLAEAAE